MFWSDFNRLSLEIKKPVKQTFLELNRATWCIIVFIPAKAVKTFKSRIKNKKIKIIVVPSISYDFESLFYLKILNYLDMPPPRINVVVTAIYIGIMSKIKSIYLIGIDMDRIYSFKVDQISNKSYMNYVHFSGSKDNSVKFRNKFVDRKETSLYIKLKREATVFKWYAYIAMLSRKYNILLKNKSSKSLVDSIDR